MEPKMGKWTITTALFLIIMSSCTSFTAIRPCIFAQYRHRVHPHPSEPPSDLPSKMIQNRVVYIGMPITPAVTELIVAQLLYLNAQSKSSPITMYINSVGSARLEERTSEDIETDVFAIADCMSYIRAPVHTTCIGQAHGTAALLLSLGTQGQRSAMPNASIMLEPTNKDVFDLRGTSREEVSANRRTIHKLLSDVTKKDICTIARHLSRTQYFSPLDAVKYGLIDKVL